MVERDASILHQRVENRKKTDAKWQVLLDMKDAQIQIIKEDRDRGVSMYKDLHDESSFAAARGYEGRDNDGMPSCLHPEQDGLSGEV
jgi:hypothetical protein